ncbi:MAG: hypothetical protein LIO90_01670 [Bacteroidales bacterium]|nr:hypothetical protein [Bacteroidales bacterium]
MKKTILILAGLMLILSCGLSANAQERLWAEKLYINLSTNAGIKHKSMAPVWLDFSAGWKVVPQLYVFGSCQPGFCIVNCEPENLSISFTDLGGGLGWRFLQNDSEFKSLDLRVSVLTTVGNSNWKHTSYGADIMWRLPSCSLGSLAFALGYKFYDIRSSSLPSMGTVTATIGFSF